MKAFASLVLDDSRSLGAMAAAAMSLHSMLMAIGRCYTTDAAGDRAALKLGRVESVLAAGCFRRDRVDCVCCTVVKSHAFRIIAATTIRACRCI